MSAITQLEKDFTKNSLGYSALGIILSTCIGSVAIFQILQFGHSFWYMAAVLLCVTICSLHNAAILTVQAPKLIFRLLVLSVLVNSLIIILSMFF